MKTTIQILLLTAISVMAAGCDGNGFNLGSNSVQEDVSEYTIMLIALSAQNHVTNAIHYKTETEKDTGWKGLFVVHKATHSTLYWGKYKTPQDAQKNLREAKKYAAPATKAAIYKRAMIIPIPGKKVGPPEWELNNAVGEYSVAVAVFYNVPEKKYVGRKQFAIDYCKQLHEDGYDAYYQHGVSRSTVSIGAFPNSSIEEIVRDNKVVDLKIVDSRITDITKKFEFLAVNGRKELLTKRDPLTGKQVTIPLKSYVIRIPKKETDKNGEDPRTYNIDLQSWQNNRN